MNKKYQILVVAVIFTLLVPAAVILFGVNSSEVVNRVATVAEVLALVDQNKKRKALVKLHSGERVHVDVGMAQVVVGDKLPIIVDEYVNNKKSYRFDDKAWKSAL